MPTDKFISIFGIADGAIIYCLDAAFKPCLRHDEKICDMNRSPIEVQNSTVIILLLIAGLESYGRRAKHIIRSNPIYSKYLYLFIDTNTDANKAINGVPISNPLSELISIEFKNKNPLYQIHKRLLTCILQETIQVRNSIAHNHLYECTVNYDEDGEILDWAYNSKDKEFRGKYKKTDVLKLNKIPIQIGFLDAIKALIVFDVSIILLQETITGINFRFGGYHKLDNNYIEDLKDIIDFYLNKLIEGEKFDDCFEINKIIIKLSGIVKINSSVKLTIPKTVDAELKKYGILRKSIINYVEKCKVCNKYSYFKNNRCLNCEIKEEQADLATS